MIHRSRRSALLSALLLWFFCRPPALADTGMAPDPALLQSTREMANELTTQLGATLKKTLSTEGPVAAVSVCKEVAPAIARDLSERHAARVSRVGTRARNPQTGVPNDWQQQALAEFEQRLGAGEPPAALEYWRVVGQADGQRELRYAKAITVQPMCLSCHGPAADIPAALADKLRVDYPHDRATGYSVGQLRGAVVVTRPLPPQVR